MTHLRERDVGSGSSDSTIEACVEAPGQLPLYVDLDGTLTPYDTLHYLLRRLALSQPWLCWDLPWRALQGRCHFKRHVSDRIALSPTELPFRASVLRFLEEQQSAGRELVLATAADHRIAHAVADHLGVFGHVLATTTGVNLKGQRKLDAIHAEVGTGFHYMGDSMADLPIFAEAQHSILVQPSRRLRSLVSELGISYTVIAD